MNFEIYKYSKKYRENLKNMWLDFIQDYEGSDLNIVPSQENAERWIKFVENIIDSEKGNLLIAIVNENLIGYILYAWDASPLETKIKVSIIYDLYVIPQFRHRGFGSALLKYSLQDLKEHGSEIVQLNVMSKNTNAIKLYEKFGFKETLKVMRLHFPQNKY